MTIGWVIVWVVVAAMVGGCFGVLLMALMNVASDADAHIDRMENER